MGFKALEEISFTDAKDILAKININREAFLDLLSSNIESNKDMYTLIVKTMSKVCQSSFDELKLRLLLEIINSQFIVNLRNYIMDLPFTEQKDKIKNKYYWTNPNQFWEHLIVLFECIFNMVPSLALQKCRSLIEATSRLCLEELQTRHEYKLSEEIKAKFIELRSRITEFEIKEKEDKSKPKTNTNKDAEENEPPEDFRELGVLPTHHDLLNYKPYVRKNIVSGGYRDAEHYLDVQFRLLREDCFGPLRDGIRQYIEDRNRKKYDNIRIYQNVRFDGPYVNKNIVGVILQLDDKNVKRLKNINWTYSKRFIYGSLLLFTKDYCHSFIIATIIDRDVKLLAAGRIPINIIEQADVPSIANIQNETYLMIESEVYFEPYQHVLKALQDRSFSRNLAMSKYIVNVEPEARPPKYVTDSTEYTVETNGLRKRFNVLQTLTWPSHEDLNFNQSQYEAYKLALTHEFAVIQGPPGTGKTYIGVKVAETLLKNFSTYGNSDCLMLVICYTNHALDQFLEHILKITSSVVRIGGQSRNPAMEAVSLNSLRRSKGIKSNHAANNLYFTERQNLRLITAELRSAQNNIDKLRDGILSYECLAKYVPEVNILQQFYGANGDIILKWLFEHMPITLVDRIELEQNETHEQEFSLDWMFEEDDTRNTVTHNDFWDTEEINIYGIELETTLLLEDIERKLSRLKSIYKRSKYRLEKQDLYNQICELYSRVLFFKEMRDSFSAHGVPREIRPGENMSRMPNADRWRLYFTWVNDIIRMFTEMIKPLQKELNSSLTAYEEARMNLDLNLIKGTKVIGMTTSGAARLRKLLQTLAPPIVIVEEAAEILEQHIVTSLSSSCEHLILIGDHQQLRPSAAYMRLARHYNIEVSLFERMVLNGMHSRRLDVQHRMRPEIAALISPHIYPDLANHPSVEAFPHVRGITADLFFYTHNFKEEAVEDSASRTNHKEADMTLGLANYLMQQDYKPEDITILAAYSGQMFYMKKQRPNYAFLSKVKITVVDNYQGEESKIILLSLVRNNDQNKIGFLDKENRICVALSRAREGFYIFGNIKILKDNSTLWTKICKTLEDMGSIGTNLVLQCENHPDQLSMINTHEDFQKVPEGGCLLKCNYNLPACGHRCPRICHGYDKGHSEEKCQLKCERVICELGHACPLKCAQKCKPCIYLVAKTLPCGHTKQVYCNQEPNDPTIKCNTPVAVTLRYCGHETKKPCHQNIETVICMVPCVFRVEGCGHQCRRRCHVNDDPDHEKYLCLKPCAKAKNGCTANLSSERGDHQCSRKCHETCDDCNVEVMKKRSNCKHSERIECCKDVNEKPCRKNCARTLPGCNHFCKKKCYEPCGDCNQKVKTIIPDCNHTIEVLCKIEPKREMCKAQCERMMACGHKCRNICGLQCDEKTCMEIVNRQFDSPCGHKVKLPCKVFSQLMQGSIDQEAFMNYCNEPCNMTLKCNHFCRGTCSLCLQGRLHAPCTQPCHVTMICGHQCEEPCNQLCPPCKKPCEVKCAHSRCNKICGAPCVPCQEDCNQSCAHGACSRRCGEPCSVAACDAACARPLPCGHPCRGLCGEPCPDICHQCRPDTFPKDFLGYDFDDDAKFIQLQDCSHIMEVEDADNLMKSDKETVAIRSCPFCRKPIINTYRYKDLINEMYKMEINPIKERVYGTKAQVIEKSNKLKEALTDFLETHKITLEGNSHLRKVYEKILHTFTKEKKPSVLQIDIYFINIDILDMIVNYYKKFEVAKLIELKEDFLKQIKMLCIFLKNCTQKVSQQQQEDIGRELNRMNSMIQLSKIISHPTYKAAKSELKITKAFVEAKSSVISLAIYQEDMAILALNQLQEAVKLSGIISKAERDLVVQAIGLKQGHWFKCPNGHFYCIGECGGAMQESKCIECEAAIGGQNHRLLSSNTLAKEIDGARFAAWSEENNNMANYDLNF
ncbi:unnamed protein product [Chilo suppressalis]|uniref:RZ-type domain-containing protein n=1 Tax=Chilo suppressalis TaxID=168631 RepID=A0ABN8AZJ1_CHISP|nr:unnamed protein product [Chilo suppressalis]